MLSIERKGLRLEIIPEKGIFSIRSQRYEDCSVDESWLAYQLQNENLIFAEFLQLQSSTELNQTGPGGTHFEGFELRYRDEAHQINFIVELGLMAEQPMLLLRERLQNQGEKPVWPERILAGIIQNGKLRLGTGEMEPVFTTNGWQSWSPCASYRLGDKQTRSWMGPIANPMIVNPGTPFTRKENHFSSDMFSCLGNLNSHFGLVAGYLAQREAYGSIETCLSRSPNLAVWANTDGLRLDPGKDFQTDWASFSFCDLRAKLPFSLYLQTTARENKVSNKLAAPLGWCSWYYYFQNLREADIRENLAKVDELRQTLPLELVQIDDGFEKSVGEWLDFSAGFPNGVQDLAAEIKSKGLTPGLWLAPFIVESRSGLVKKHPGWLLRDRHGRPANSGFVWNRLGKALDLTNPDAMAYVEKVIHTAVREWGFSYLKLDFLYAASLKCRYQNPIFTRAQVLRQGLEKVRAAAGEETLLLGCGCPLGPAIGLMDYMRISSDVSPDWEPRYFGHKRLFRNELNMPSAHNAIRNIISRSELDGHWWGNDPDCLLVREDSNLSLDEVRSLATTIGMTAGAVLISDRLSTLSEERLPIVQALLPVIQNQVQIVDRFEHAEPYMLKQDLHTAAGAWPVIAIFNWESQARDLPLAPSEWGLPKGKKWIAREFWSGQIFQWEGELLLKNLPPHGAYLLTLHEQTGASVYLGSEFHFSQGYELEKWHEDEHELRFTLKLGRIASGKIYLWLPRKPRFVSVNGLEATCQNTDTENVYAIPLEIDDCAEIRMMLEE